MGVAAVLVLEVTLNKRGATRSLASVEIPARLGSQISSTGGENLQVQWVEEGTEVLGTAPMPNIAALKGSLG